MKTLFGWAVLATVMVVIVKSAPPMEMESYDWNGFEADNDTAIVGCDHAPTQILTPDGRPVTPRSLESNAVPKRSAEQAVD